jgi:hypothetical protein
MLGVKDVPGGVSVHKLGVKSHCVGLVHSSGLVRIAPCAGLPLP